MELRDGARLVRLQVLQVEAPHQEVLAPDVLWHQVDLDIQKNKGYQEHLSNQARPSAGAQPWCVKKLFGCKLPWWPGTELVWVSIIDCFWQTSFHRDRFILQRPSPLKSAHSEDWIIEIVLGETCHGWIFQMFTVLWVKSLGYQGRAGQGGGQK